MTNLELYCKTFGLEKDYIDKAMIPPAICNICPIVKRGSDILDTNSKV